MKITNIKRQYNDEKGIEKILFSIIESQLDLKLQEMYNQQLQADTVAPNSKIEGRVA
jgi:hypothetical protein